MPDSKSVKSVQSAGLISTLGRNRDCEYGREYQFSVIDSPERYREYVPLVGYEALRSRIDRIARGEDAILTSERVLSFFKTSGSLASPKLIPVTQSLVREKASAFSAYWSAVYKSHPTLKNGLIINNFSDSGSVERTPSGREVVSESSYWNRRAQLSNPRSTQLIPAIVRKIKNPRIRHLVVARLCLQNSLKGIMCLNPSTLLYFCRTIAQHRDVLARGLRDGNWGSTDSAIVSHIPSELGAVLEKAKAPAQNLESSFDCQNNMQLRALWPEMSLVITWNSTIVQPYLSQLQNTLSGIAHRDYITQSSECIMAVPERDNLPGGELAWAVHFYEFIPSSQVESAAPETCFAWQLEEGETYELVVTTGGGLYRYRTGDCVRVNAFNEGVPVIEFLYRVGKTSSITGEKLTEFHILDALSHAKGVCDKSPLEVLAFPRSGAIPHYGILVEWPGWNTGQALSSAHISEIKEWLRVFESRLCAVNSEYADKRNSERLGKPVALLTSAEGFHDDRQNRKAVNVSDEQLKTEVLTARLDIDSMFTVFEVVNAH